MRPRDSSLLRPRRNRRIRVPATGGLVYVPYFNEGCPVRPRCRVSARRAPLIPVIVLSPIAAWLSIGSARAEGALTQQCLFAAVPEAKRETARPKRPTLPGDPQKKRVVPVNKKHEAGPSAKLKPPQFESGTGALKRAMEKYSSSAESAHTVATEPPQAEEGKSPSAQAPGNEAGSTPHAPAAEGHSSQEHGRHVHVHHHPPDSPQQTCERLGKVNVDGHRECEESKASAGKPAPPKTETEQPDSCWPQEACLQDSSRPKER